MTTPENSAATAVDGGIVVGASEVSSFLKYPIIWTAADGMRHLGSLGGTYGDAAAVSGGNVVGWSQTVIGVKHAFLWTEAGGMQDLGTLGDPSGDPTRGLSFATAVDGGNVVGGSHTADSFDLHAFLWTAADGMQDLGTAGHLSLAKAVSGGNVVGSCGSHAFLWTASDGLQDLGVLGAPSVGVKQSSEATAVDGGNVVGKSTNYNSSATATGAFLWTASDGMQALGSLGGHFSEATAVSGSNVVGRATNASGKFRAFLWTAAGGMQNLGTLPGGTFSEARAVSGGYVVGKATNASSKYRAFLWTAEGGMQDLGTLPGGDFSEATAVSGGSVVGNSTTANGSMHAFLWTAEGGMQDLGTLIAPSMNVAAYDSGTSGAVGVQWDPSPSAVSPSAYEIRYGTVPGQYPSSILIEDPRVTGYHITGLQNGIQHFFAMRLIAVGGQESVLSNEASATPSTDTSDYERALSNVIKAEASLAKAREFDVTFDFDGEVGLRMATEVQATVSDAVAEATVTLGSSSPQVQSAFALLSQADASIAAGNYVDAVKQLRQAFNKVQPVP